MGQQYSLDDEDDENDRRPARPPRGGPPSLSFVLTIISIAAWGCLLLAVGCGGLLFCVSLSKSNSAPQEAALGAVFSTVFIGLYITVRCIEKLLTSVERLRSKPPGA